MSRSRRSPGHLRLQRWVFHPLQAALLYALLGLFRMLPVDWSSWLGSRLLRTIAPLMAGPKRRARRTLAICFPDMDEREREKIIAGMWDNLGRVAGEYPHLTRILDDPGRVEIVHRERFEAARAAGRPVVLISAHLANWEIAAHAAGRLAPPVALIYRAPNNRLLDPVIRRLRENPGLRQLRKGSEAAKGSVKILSEGGTLALLVDQRLSSGIPVPFFGRPAMTAPAVAQFAMRFDAVILPAQLCRLGGARFRLVIEEPIEVPRSGDRAADILAVMTRVNETLERWIREHPEQWLWIHRRWKD
jgi:KDO2-lipid IV(A) lauroyltransferase